MSTKRPKTVRGRPPAFSVTHERTANQPKELARWLLVLPRYGKLWQKLHGGENSIRALLRSLRVNAEELFAMLDYFESLGALSKVEVNGQTRITLHRLPTVWDFNPNAVDVSPWHGNQRAEDEAFEAVRVWTAAYRKLAGRPYTADRVVAELQFARDMLGKYEVPIGDLIDIMVPFLEEAKALGDLDHFVPAHAGGHTKKSEESAAGHLKLLRYVKYRRYGPTFSTFCSLYADVALQLHPEPKGKVEGRMRAGEISRIAGTPLNLKRGRVTNWQRRKAREDRAKEQERQARMDADPAVVKIGEVLSRRAAQRTTS